MAKSSKALTVIKKVVWGIVCAIFGFVLVVLGWLAVDKFILKSPVPKAFGFATLTIATGSMQGTIDIGDVIVIRKTDDYKRWDIITFLLPGDKIPTTHRIIAVNPDGSFVTKGDSNNTEDKTPVTRDMIHGEVVLTVKNLGHFVNWVRMEGWLYIVSLLAIIGIGGFLLKGSADQSEEDSSDGGSSEDSAENSAESADASTTGNASDNGDN